jgi:Transposase DDE domain
VAVAYIRTVKTASRATAVQIVHSNRRGSRDIEHIGSAHTPEDVETLKAVARQRLHARQDTLDLGDGRPEGQELPITSTRSKHLWDALCLAYTRLGFDRAAERDEVFQALVLARVVEPTSKLATIRVLDEIGVSAPGYRTIFRRLPAYASEQWRQRLARVCAARVGLGPATLVLYDVTTLYFETDEGDGFREPGFSKERRLEPQITVGLLTDVRGFPLMVHAFEGNRAETKTMLPVVQAFAAAHQLPEVTVVADAGMLSEANLKDLEDAQLRFIVGARIPDLPYQVAEWQRHHPGEPIGDGQIFVQPMLMGPKADLRRRTIFYQYRTGRAKRTLKGIDTQIAKAEKAVTLGPAAVKRNRFVQLSGGTRSVNRDLEAKARALAGLKGYVTNLESPTAEYVMGAYHQLWQIEKSFRMSKTDLRARPIYHHQRDSIEAHLTIVFAALAVSRLIERATGWSISRFVKTLRRYHTVTIQAGSQTITAADPLPDEVSRALTDLRDADQAH